jgi:large subunit ribosomal protein L1
LSSTAPLAKGAPKRIEPKKEKTVGSKGQNPQKNKKKGVAETQKRKARTTYIQYDLRDAEKFSLCDAMRYISCGGLREELY